MNGQSTFTSAAEDSACELAGQANPSSETAAIIPMRALVFMDLPPDVNGVDFTAEARDVNGDDMGVASRATYHHGSLPDALLEAAERLIRQKGVAAFSLREAARAIQVDPSACYRHFRDRDDVLQALGRRGFTKLAVRFERAIAGIRTPEAALRTLARTYVEFALESPAEFHVMFGPNGLIAFDPRLRGDYPRSPFEILLHTLRAWRKKTSKDDETMAMSLWAVVHGVASFLVDRVWRPEVHDWRSILDGLLDRLLVLPAPTPRKRRAPRK
jgi:AcrR family transcriptional regulator